MNNYCLRNWRLVKTRTNNFGLGQCSIGNACSFQQSYQVFSGPLIKTRYGPCMELSPERITTTKELSGQKLRSVSYIKEV